MVEPPGINCFLIAPPPHSSSGMYMLFFTIAVTGQSKKNHYLKCGSGRQLHNYKLVQFFFFLNSLTCLLFLCKQ